MENQLNDLPENVKRCLMDFTHAAKDACSDILESIVLFGSAAEGRLRPSSDVNLILVLKNFEVSRINRLREILRVSHAAIRLNVMFILESEIAVASEAFAVKFADILHRHRVLYGPDPFKDLKVSRSATVQRLQQVIVNLMLRLRERYALVSLREEQLVPIIADVTGPIRASAASILALEDNEFTHPKEALEAYVRQLSGNNWSEVLKNMSIAREEQDLKTGAAASTILALLDLLKEMQNHVERLK